MKRIFIALALLTLTVMSGTALANTVSVDFSVLNVDGIEYPVDITLENNSAGLTLNGVNFGYDNFGNSADFAIADSAGIWGRRLGHLIFNFSTPVP